MYTHLISSLHAGRVPKMLVAMSLFFIVGLFHIYLLYQSSHLANTIYTMEQEITSIRKENELLTIQYALMHNQQTQITRAHATGFTVPVHPISLKQNRLARTR